MNKKRHFSNAYSLYKRFVLLMQRHVLTRDDFDFVQFTFDFAIHFRFYRSYDTFDYISLKKKLFVQKKFKKRSEIAIPELQNQRSCDL